MISLTCFRQERYFSFQTHFWCNIKVVLQFHLNPRLLQSAFLSHFNKSSEAFIHFFWHKVALSSEAHWKLLPLKRLRTDGTQAVQHSADPHRGTSGRVFHFVEVENPFKLQKLFPANILWIGRDIPKLTALLI